MILIFRVSFVYPIRRFQQIRLRKMKYCLVATLGTEAQVITTVLDCLLDSKKEIVHVHVIHTTSNDRSLQLALEKLKKECISYSAYRNIKFHFCPILSSGGEEVADLDSIEAGKASFNLLYETMLKIKHEDFKIFLCISGGRKNLSLYGISAAQLLFDEDDKIIHIYSPNSHITSKSMHPTNFHEINLVEIPVLLWSSISPAYLLLSDTVDPIDAIEKYKAIHLEERIEKGRVFLLSTLSKAEHQVVELLVYKGLSDRAIGQILNLSERTVESHIRSARMKAEKFFHLTSLNRARLIVLLQPAVTFLQGGKFRENTDELSFELN